MKSAAADDAMEIKMSMIWADMVEKMSHRLRELADRSRNLEPLFSAVPATSSFLAQYV